MATYSSSLVSSNAPVPSHGLFNNLKAISATVSCTAAPSTSDTIQFFTLPKNAVVQGYKVGATQMDSNGSPTLAFNIGDAGSATRLFSGVAVGRTSGGSWIGDTGAGATYTGVGYQFTADTQIVAVPSANAATGAAGTITLTVFYTLAGGAS